MDEKKHHKKGKYHKRNFLMLALLCIINSFAYGQIKKNSEPSCRPAIDYSKPQYIVGYGSLMQEKSKRSDAANVGNNYPIYITGFERGWIEHSANIVFNTTYLGISKKAGARMNAVYFKLSNPRHLNNYDRREDTYCRVKINPQQIRTVEGLLPEGQFWIYTTKNSRKNLPTSRYPIIQSYVDIFLSGCLEMEEKYKLKNFAEDCVKTTAQWSTHWINDRVNPHRAANNIPYVKINTLLAKELPHTFSSVIDERTKDSR